MTESFPDLLKLFAALKLSKLAGRLQDGGRVRSAGVAAAAACLLIYRRPWNPNHSGPWWPSDPNPAARWRRRPDPHEWGYEL